MLLSRFSRVRLCVDPIDSSHQAPLSLGFSRQEHRSGLPFPSPMHKNEKWKLSRSVVSDPQRPQGLQPSRLLRPWDFPGKSTGVGCHCLLRKLPYGPAILLLGIYPEKNMIWKETCTPIFIVALFTIAKMRKQPTMSVNRGVDQEAVLRIYNGPLYILTIKKDEVMQFAATWMDLEIVTLSEINQRRRNIIWYPLYADSKKNDTGEIIYKTETDSQTENELAVARGEKQGEGIVREFEINMYTLLYLKWITNKILLYIIQRTLLSDMC